MPSGSGSAFLGQVVLGEHELRELVHEDDALAVFAARSTIDGGAYTVALLQAVEPTSGSTEIAAAAARASRQAVGVPGVLPLLAARSDQGRVWVVRRGEVGQTLRDELGRPHTFREAHALLARGAKGLEALHDIGQIHGALSPAAFVRIDDRDALAWTGISTIAEAAAGLRALSSVAPRAFRPPELQGDVPKSLGPWTDVHAFARLCVALLAGTAEPRDDLEGLSLPAPLEKALGAALASSPAQRPADVRAIMGALASAGDGVATGAAFSAPPAETVVAPSPADPAPAEEPSAAVAPRDAAPVDPSPLVPAPLAPPAPEAPKRRDRLGLLITLTGLLAGVVFLAGIAGTAVLLLRSKAAAPLSPATTAVPGPIAVPPTPTLGPPATPDPGPTADTTPPFAPRPHGEVATTKEDEEALLPVLADDPVRGDRRAPVTLVLFADLTCPHSRRLIASLPQLESSLGPILRVVVKTYPLPDRSDARDVAEAALAVRRKGGTSAYFAFALALARGGEKTDPGSLEEMGIKAGAPAGAVTEALRARSERARVEANVIVGRKLAVTATPVVFLNGRRFDGLLPVAFLEREIRAEATRARDLASRIVTPDAVYKARVFSNVTTAEADGPRRLRRFSRRFGRAFCASRDRMGA